MLHFRAAHEQDFDEICALPQDAQELFYMFPKAHYPLTREQLRASVASRRDSSVVVWKGKVAGFANLYRWEIGGTCSIGNFIISKEHRNQGLGRYLLREMIALAKRTYQAKQISVSCFNPNTNGLALYLRNGFSPFDAEQRVDLQGQIVILLHLNYDLTFHESQARLASFLPSDVPTIQKLASKKGNSDNTNLPYPYPDDGAQSYQKIVEENWRSNKSREFVIHYGDTAIGMAGILHLDKPDTKPQLGYWIDDCYWNKGIGTWVVQQLIDYARHELHLESLEAHVLETNTASRRILEKNAFTLQSHYHLPYDHFKYPHAPMVVYEYRNTPTP